ncbi:MAG: hypothetical protein KF803_11500 [Cyclobacteriaceae bacterium]|nr:hypothetical protein [Cyclobacteriaceae bacterium]
MDLSATKQTQNVVVHAFGQKSKMNDRDYLLIKATLTLLAAATCFGAGYYTFDNKIIGLSIATILAAGIAYRTYMSTIKTYQDKESEIIFNGFNLKGQIIYIAFWATMTYFFLQDNKGLHYLFYGLFFLILAIEEGLRLIIFDFNKKKVIGLFDNKNQDFGQLTIDHIQDDNSDKIKVTDKSGFFLLDKSNFSDSNWTRLANYLNKIKTET